MLEELEPISSAFLLSLLCNQFSHNRYGYRWCNGSIGACVGGQNGNVAEMNTFFQKEWLMSCSAYTTAVYAYTETRAPGREATISVYTRVKCMLTLYNCDVFLMKN